MLSRGALRRGCRGSLGLAAIILLVSPSTAGAARARATLEDASVRPKEVNTWRKDAQVKVRLEIRSEHAVKYLSVMFDNRAKEGPIPLWTESFRLRQGTRRNGVWRAKLTVPRYSQHGRWWLDHVWITDVKGDHRFYHRPELRRRGLGTSFFQVGPADQTAPALEHFEITPTQYESSAEWSELNTYAEIREDQSGYENMTMGLEGPIHLGYYGIPWAPRYPRSTIRIPGPGNPRPTPGNYAISLELRDLAGNIRTYTPGELKAAGWTSSLTWR